MNRRGFTLMEMSIVVSLLGLVFTASTVLFLEGRSAVARSEAHVELTRSASLATEWLAREIRSAEKVEPLEDGVACSIGDRRITLRAEGGRLIRAEGEERLAIARGVRRLTVTPRVSGGHQIDLTLWRDLVFGREIRIERQFWVGPRR
jgi:prepilin-type N-terminal cleavage/methylation domain-containing protein